jgi:hypothetical protein
MGVREETGSPPTENPRHSLLDRGPRDSAHVHPWSIFGGGGPPAWAGGYTAGCNHLPPGDRTTGPIGAAIAGGRPSTQNTTTHDWSKTGSDWEHAVSPTGVSYVSQTLYWYVGPPNGAGRPNTPAGCLDPIRNRTGQTATFEWQLTYRAYAAANCTGNKTATASANVELIGNIHLNRPPLFVFPVSPSLPLWASTVSCGKSSTGTVHTGYLNLTTPAFNLTGGTDYDFYSGVTTGSSASAGKNTTAFAGVTVVRASLVKVTCTC